MGWAHRTIRQFQLGGIHPVWPDPIPSNSGVLSAEPHQFCLLMADKTTAVIRFIAN